MTNAVKLNENES